MPAAGRTLQARLPEMQQKTEDRKKEKAYQNHVWKENRLQIRSEEVEKKKKTEEEEKAEKGGRGEGRAATAE